MRGIVIAVFVSGYLTLSDKNDFDLEKMQSFLEYQPNRNGIIFWQ